LIPSASPNTNQCAAQNRSGFTLVSRLIFNPGSGQQRHDDRRAENPVGSSGSHGAKYPKEIDMLASSLLNRSQKQQQLQKQKQKRKQKQNREQVPAPGPHWCK
jgi:hypothetical protein